MSFRSGIWTLNNIPSPQSVHSPTNTTLIFFCSHQVIQRVKELIPNIEINEFYQCMCPLSLPPFLSHSFYNFYTQKSKVPLLSQQVKGRGFTPEAASVQSPVSSRICWSSFPWWHVSSSLPPVPIWPPSLPPTPPLPPPTPSTPPRTEIPPLPLPLILTSYVIMTSFVPRVEYLRMRTTYYHVKEHLEIPPNPGGTRTDDAWQKSSFGRE